MIFVFRGPLKNIFRFFLFVSLSIYIVGIVKGWKETEEHNRFVVRQYAILITEKVLLPMVLKWRISHTSNFYHFSLANLTFDIKWLKSG